MQAGARIVQEADLTACDVLATLDRLPIINESPVRSAIRVSRREKTLRLSSENPAVVERPESINTAALASDFAVRDGTITTCIAMQLGRHAMQQALDGLQERLARLGAKGRVDTLARKPEQVLRKIKKGKSVRQPRCV